MPGEQQHYVPKFLLKNFTHGKKPKVFVYDKSNDKRFHTNIRNVAAESGFYDIALPDGILTLEPGLAHLETHASGIIKKLIHEKNIRSLNEHDFAILAVFLAVQFVRTKEHRLRFEDLGQMLEQKLLEMGATDDNIQELKRGPNGVAEEKLIGIKSVLDANEFVPHFLNKVWVLFETNRKQPFFTSDNPLTLHNEVNHGPYGNIGLAVTGIEIYLPISSTLCLGLLCPTIAEKFQKAHENMKVLDSMAPGLADSAMNKPDAARAFCEGMINGTPIRIIEDNLQMLNSLQVMYSSRFVYCETESFELVERMLRDNDKFREGLKSRVN